ncbi:hypothetical protein SBBP2_1240015 [Burkholderiales bacterium]|nr:hypothetical protein SBBP2_1240015 [Burkholderiales bacterium]
MADASRVSDGLALSAGRALGVVRQEAGLFVALVLRPPGYGRKRFAPPLFRLYFACRLVGATNPEIPGNSLIHRAEGNWGTGHEIDHSDHQAVQTRRGARGPIRGRGAGHYSNGRQRLRSTKGPC